MNTTTKRLPDDPVELAEIALRDVERVRGMEGYRLEMMEWHNPNGEVCEVCVAGAIMVCELGANSDDAFEPDSFDLDTRIKLIAVNRMRQGLTLTAMSALGLPTAGVPNEAGDLDNSDDPDVAIANVRECIKVFRELGYGGDA